MTSYNYYVINKSFISMFWKNFWDSNVLYKQKFFFIIFLKFFLVLILNEQQMFFFKQIFFSNLLLGQIWIYIYQTFFIINLNVVKILNKKFFIFTVKNFNLSLKYKFLL
jgi:hypothetical protein